MRSRVLPLGGNGNDTLNGGFGSERSPDWCWGALVDFAKQMKNLVDIHCPEAEVIRLVVDNLNIHNPAALYEVFEPQ